MLIDILFIVLLVMAVFKGWQRGLIVAVFSVFALLAGLAAAVKLSAMVAIHLKEEVHLTFRWLPVLAFVLVFLIVILLVRWAAGLISAGLDLVLLGWVNKISGIVLYAIIYLVTYSVFLFYATKIHLIPQQVMDSSVVYGFIEPWGPVTINAMGKIIPVFKNMFAELEHFFGQFA